MTHINELTAGSKYQGYTVLAVVYGEDIVNLGRIYLAKPNQKNIRIAWFRKSEQFSPIQITNITRKNLAATLDNLQSHGMQINPIVTII